MKPPEYANTGHSCMRPGVAEFGPEAEERLSDAVRVKRTLRNRKIDGRIALPIYVATKNNPQRSWGSGCEDYS
jgi:hypothetical protein